MATTVITGRDLSLTIDSKAYDAQVTSATLKTDLERNAYETIDGKVFYALDSSATISVTMLADWGASAGVGTFSICELMWAAASSAPNTSLAYTFTAASGAVFTGSVYPSFPDASGTGKDAQTVTFVLQGTAKPTLTIS
jgi:hypothetical protein